MLDQLKNLMGLGPSTDYAQLIKLGAVVLDVRSKTEYAGGHIAGSLNIAVDQLNSNLHRLPDKNTPIITCCASGVRSAMAKRILTSAGYQDVYNGGSWNNLQDKL